MKPAQERLEKDLQRTIFQELQVPLVNNWQAALVTTGADARYGLYEQVPNTVRWVESMRLLIANGVTHCIEVGPGGVLCGLMRNIDPSIACQKFGESSDWEKLAACASA